MERAVNDIDDNLKRSNALYEQSKDGDYQNGMLKRYLHREMDELSKKGKRVIRLYKLVSSKRAPGLHK